MKCVSLTLPSLLSLTDGMISLAYVIVQFSSTTLLHFQFPCPTKIFHLLASISYCPKFSRHFQTTTLYVSNRLSALWSQCCHNLTSIFIFSIFISAWRCIKLLLFCSEFPRVLTSFLNLAAATAV